MSNDAARFRELQELRDEQTAVAAGRHFRGAGDLFAPNQNQNQNRDERDYDDELDNDQLDQYFGDDGHFDATANPLVPRLGPASAESIKDPLAMAVPRPRKLSGITNRVGQPKLDAGPPDYSTAAAMNMVPQQAKPADTSFFVGAGPGLPTGLGTPSAAPEKQKRTRKRSSSSSTADKPARKAVASARDFDTPAPAYAQRMDMARAAADAVMDAEAAEDFLDGDGDVADPGLPAPGAERLGGGLAPPMPPDIPQYRPAQSLELARLNKLYPEPPRPIEDDSEDDGSVAVAERPEPVCFACQYGGDMVPLVCSRQFDDINRIVNSLDKPMLKRTEDIYEYYERFVRQPGNRQRRPTDPEYLEWSHRQIFQHYFTPTHGRTCARYSLEWRTNTLEMAAYTLSETNLIMEDTRTGTRVVNPAALDQFLKLNRELNLMYKVDLQKLNGVASASSAPVQNASHVLAGPNRTVGKVKSVVFR